LTISFDLEELWQLKQANPEWIILLGDKSKNPSKLVGAWKDMKTQTMADLQALVSKAQSSEVEAWNFGPRTGLGGLACLDWDWEFSPEGQRSAWCNTHLELVLSRYDSKSYDIKFGSGGYPDG
jgi:hypothetical protein